MGTERNARADQRPATPQEASQAAVGLSRIYWAAFQASLDTIVGAGHGNDRSTAAHTVAKKVMDDLGGNCAATAKHTG